MNKWLFCLVLLLPISLSAATRSGTVFTNTARIYGGPYVIDQTNVFLTAGSIYGLSALISTTNVYIGYPIFTLRIPFSITNLGNDADSNAQIFVELLSNNPGYAASAWNYSIEVSSVTQGTNYAIPYASFGEGAIFSFNLVVYIPADCPSGSSGFFRVIASTLSNTGHVAAQYTGYNLLNYGGIDTASNDIRININLPNQITSIFGTDGIDTINIFNGLYGLRRTKNSITLNLANAPFNLNSLYLWYAVDSLADGSFGPNTADTSVKMTTLSSKQFQGDIPGNALSKGSILSFVFEIDGVTYLTNLTYRLLDLGSQDNYQTVLMHNVIDYKSGDYLYIKLPDKLMGKEGKVYIFSISGDLVYIMSTGNLDQQILKWNGMDKTKAWVAKGMYFIVIDFADLKEVRKVYVK